MNVSAHLSDETEHSPEDSYSPWRLAFSAPASCQVERFSQLMLRHFKLHVITVYSESPCHCAAFPWHSGRLPGCSFTFRPSALSPSVLVLRSLYVSSLVISSVLTASAFTSLWLDPKSLSPILSPQVQTCIPSCLLFISHWKLDVNTSAVRFITFRHCTSPRPHPLYPEFLSRLTHAGHCRDLTIFTQAMLPGCSSPSILLPLPISPCCLFPGGLPSVCPVPVTGIDFLDKT